MCGNGQIIQELASLFIGAGCNVIKVLWDSEWDGLSARDTDNALLRRFAQTVDGHIKISARKTVITTGRNSSTPIRRPGH